VRRLALIAVLATVVSGCGRVEEDSDKDFKGEQQRVAKAVEDLQDAGSERDENRICERLLARELVQRLKQAGAADCASAIDDVLKDADAFELDVKKVTLEGTTASAVVESDGGDRKRTDTLRLVRERGEWRIASLGS
jgi:hypothetical protein